MDALMKLNSSIYPHTINGAELTCSWVIELCQLSRILHACYLLASATLTSHCIYIYIPSHSLRASDLQFVGIRLDFVQLTNRLYEPLIVFVAHALNILVMVLYTSAQTLQEVVLVFPIIQSTTNKK